MRLVLKNSKLVFGKVSYVTLADFRVGSLSFIENGNITYDTSYQNCATSSYIMQFDNDVVISTTKYEFCIWYKVNPNGEDSSPNYSRDGYDYSIADKKIPAGTKFVIVMRTGTDTSVVVDIEEVKRTIIGREDL